MKTEEKQPIESEAQLLEEDELGKVSGGGPGPTDWIYVAKSLNNLLSMYLC